MSARRAPRRPDVEVWNPAFDVTPAELITAIITDRGIFTARADSAGRFFAARMTAALIRRRSSPSTRAPPAPPRWSSTRTAVLGRGYREFTQHFPAARLGRARPEEIFRVSVEAVREAVAGSRRAAGRARHHQPAGNSGALGPRATLAPVARAIVWQDRRTTARCRELREAGPGADAPRAHRPRRRSLLLRHQAGVAAPRCRASTPGRAGRARRRHGRQLAGREADRRPGPRHRSHQRLPHPAVRPARPRLGSPSCCALFGVPARAAARDRAVVRRGRRDRSAPPGLVAADRRAWPATSRLRSSARAASPRDWPRTPTAPARFSWSTPASVPARPDGAAGHRGVRAAGRAGLRARRQRLHRRRRGPVAARRARAASSAPPRPRRWPRRCPTPEGSTSCRRSWGWAPRTGSRRRAERSPASPGAPPGPIWSRAALEAMAYSSAELLEAMAGVRVSVPARFGWTAAPPPTTG